MSILSDFEDRVGRAVEGMFSGVFRSPVQPAELARALAKEMDRGRMLSVGKVFAPNLYTVLLSHEDDEQLGRFTTTLAGELATYLTGTARERGYTIEGKPHVRFMVDGDLRMGRFEAFAETLSPDELADELAEEPWGEGDSWDAPKSTSPSAERASIPEGPAHEAPHFVETPGHVPSPHPVQPGGGEGASATPLSTLATVTISGTDHDVVLRGDRMVVGRLSSCDICLEDRSASRQHAAFVAEGAGWAIEDLGSTNGTTLNGARVSRERLREGDHITIGLTDLVYHEPRG